MATVDEILARQAFTAGNEAWEADNSYPSYALYAEPEYVPVTNKRIADFNSQVSVRGERNTQFVGFALPRYDDSTDLAAQHLYIHYQTATGGSDSTPCNVSKSDSCIRLFWRIPAQAVQEAGDIQMMIYATGTDSAGERTVWKTLPASYTIHDGLDIGGGIPEPDTSWYEQFVAQMEGKVSTAQGYANAAQASKTAADASAAAAAQSATAATQSLGDTKAYVESQKAAFVGYSRRESDTRYSNALTGKATGSLWDGKVEISGGINGRPTPLVKLEIAGKSAQKIAMAGAQLLDPKLMPQSKMGYSVKFRLEEDGSYMVRGCANRNSTIQIGIEYPLEPGSYYVSNNQSPYGSWDLYVRVTITHADGTKKSYSYGAFEVLESDTRVYLEIVKGDKGKEGAIYPMLNAGTKAVPWEPYTGGQAVPDPAHPQPITNTGDGGKTITIRRGDYMAQTISIPFAAPLRGIGEHRDRIMRKDGEWGIERNIGVLDNGSVRWNSSSVKPGVSSGYHYSCAAPNGFYKSGHYYTPVLCTMFPQQKVNAESVDGDYISTFDTANQPNPSALHLSVHTMNPDYATFAAFRTAMANATTIYPLKTPTWEPFPAEAQAALNSLGLTGGGQFNVTVTVDGSGPAPDVTVEYIKDINSAILILQRQIDELLGGK